MNLQDFLRDDRGSATVEFVLWVPWFCALLMFTVDVSTFYLSQSRMQNVSRDAARSLSLGRVQAADLSSYVTTRLAGQGYQVIDCSDTASACVRIERAAGETLVFGFWLENLIGKNFVVVTTLPFEPEPA